VDDRQADSATKQEQALRLESHTKIERMMSVGWIKHDLVKTKLAGSNVSFKIYVVARVTKQGQATYKRIFNSGVHSRPQPYITQLPGHQVSIMGANRRPYVACGFNIGSVAAQAVDQTCRSRAHAV
jgi:hypothetical protein